MRSAGAVVEMWGRRLVTLPLYTALCVGVVSALPLLLGTAALVDLVRGVRIDWFYKWWSQVDAWVGAQEDSRIGTAAEEPSTARALNGAT